MGKTVKNPKRFIISCRVSDKELQTLQDHARASGTNLSELLRQCLNRAAGEALSGSRLSA